MLDGCLAATQVKVEITTNAKCEDIQDVSVSVGPLSELLERPPSTTTSTCVDGRIGTIVLIPATSDEGQFAVRVVGGVNQSSPACVEGVASEGCIDSRRALSFIPHEGLSLPIELELACLDVPCGATETCREGTCVSAELRDARNCTDPLGCEERPMGSGGSSSGGSSSGGSSSGGSSSGGSSSGGSPMGGANGIGGGEFAGANWQLLWHDNFNTLETERWLFGEQDSGEGLSIWEPGNASVEDGTLRLAVTADPSPLAEYRGAQLRTETAYTYGRFVARLRAAPVSGVVSRLSTFVDGMSGGRDYSTLEVDSVGDDPTRVHLRRSVRNNLGEYQTDLMNYPLGLPGTDEFHIYMLEWTPTTVRFYIDDELVLEPSPYGENFIGPQAVHLSAWVTDLEFYAGVADPDSLPAYLEVDWIEVYEYLP